MTRMLAALGDWSTGPGLLQRRLADALRAAITRGDLAPGSRLPPERSFAKSLAVSRTKIVAALVGRPSAQRGRRGVVEVIRRSAIEVWV